MALTWVCFVAAGMHCANISSRHKAFHTISSCCFFFSAYKVQVVDEVWCSILNKTSSKTNSGNKNEIPEAIFNLNIINIFYGNRIGTGFSLRYAGKAPQAKQYLSLLTFIRGEETIHLYAGSRVEIIKNNLFFFFVCKDVWGQPASQTLRHMHVSGCSYDGDHF